MTAPTWKHRFSFKSRSTLKIMQNNYCPTRRSLLLYSKISAGVPQTVGLYFFTVIEGHQGKVHDILAAQLRAMQGAGSNSCMSLSTGLGKQELQPLGDGRVTLSKTSQPISCTSGATSYPWNLSLCWWFGSQGQLLSLDGPLVAHSAIHSSHANHLWNSKGILLDVHKDETSLAELSHNRA